MKIQIKGLGNGYMVTFEHPNGDMFNFPMVVKRLLKGQDMEHWKSNPASFNVWIKDAIKTAIDNSDFVIK